MVPLLICSSSIWLVVLAFRVYSEVFGVAAKNRAWVDANKKLATDAAALCRVVEEEMLLSDGYHYKRFKNDVKYVLKPSGFNSIRFYDKEKGQRAPIYATTGSYPGKNSDLSIDAAYDLALGWHRQFTFVGSDSGTLFFDPNYDFEVTCILQKEPLKVIGFGNRMIGQ